jgi:hypothetical protein
LAQTPAPGRPGISPPPPPSPRRRRPSPSPAGANSATGRHRYLDTRSRADRPRDPVSSVTWRISKPTRTSATPTTSPSPHCHPRSRTPIGISAPSAADASIMTRRRGSGRACSERPKPAPARACGACPRESGGRKRGPGFFFRPFATTIVNYALRENRFTRDQIVRALVAKARRHDLTQPRAPVTLDVTPMLHKLQSGGIKPRYFIVFQKVYRRPLRNGYRRPPVTFTSCHVTVTDRSAQA